MTSLNACIYICLTHVLYRVAGTRNASIGRVHKTNGKRLVLLEQACGYACMQQPRIYVHLLLSFFLVKGSLSHVSSVLVEDELLERQAQAVAAWRWGRHAIGELDLELSRLAKRSFDHTIFTLSSHNLQCSPAGSRTNRMHALCMRRCQSTLCYAVCPKAPIGKFQSQSAELELINMAPVRTPGA